MIPALSHYTVASQWQAESFRIPPCVSRVERAVAQVLTMNPPPKDDKVKGAKRLTTGPSGRINPTTR